MELRELMELMELMEQGTKKPDFIDKDETGHRPGNDLLSQGLSPHYHRRNSVSLPGSGWDRVVPPCYGHQNPEEVCSDQCVVISVLLRQTSDDKQLSVCSEWLSLVLLGSWERAEFVSH